VARFCAEWAERRGALDFGTDGVVVKVDDLALRERLGGRARERALERFDRAANLPGVLDALAAAGLTPSLGRRQMQKRGATLEAA
jgi:hypothetical protein